MIINVYTFDGTFLCHAASFEADNCGFSLDIPNGFLYASTDTENYLYGIGDWNARRLGESEFFMAYHPSGNLMVRKIGNELQMASPTEIAAYNAGVSVAVGRLSYLKIMKDMLLNTGIKGLLSFLKEKVERARIDGWELPAEDTDD